MGLGCSYHPYECSHDKYCEHCTLAQTEWHKPNLCSLCLMMKDEDGRPFALVKEPFAIKVQVRDLSPRKQKIKLQRFLDEVVSKVPQQELPF